MFFAEPPPEEELLEALSLLEARIRSGR